MGVFYLHIASEGLFLKQETFEISPDESCGAIGTSNGAILLYNLSTGTLLCTLKHRRSYKAIHSVKFTSDGKSLVCTDEDSTVWRYDQPVKEKNS